MKLTNYHREAFVGGVMADVPQEDHDEQVQKVVKDLLDKMLPKEVLAMLKNPKLRQYLEEKYISLGWSLSTFYYPIPDGKDWYTINKSLTEAQSATLKKMLEGIAEKLSKRQDLCASLNAAIKSVNTVKQALELFPEFAKYLPEETGKSSNLPMVVNVVSELVKAGWPKKQPKVKK